MLTHLVCLPVVHAFLGRAVRGAAGRARAFEPLAADWMRVAAALVVRVGLVLRPDIV